MRHWMRRKKRDETGRRATTEIEKNTKQTTEKYTVQTTTKFDRSVKRLNEKDQDMVWDVIYAIAYRRPLLASCKDHPLKGDKRGLRECHVKNDLVLTYTLDRGVMVLTAVDVGSHSNVLRI